MIKFKKLFWNQIKTIQRFPVSHILLLTISIVLISEIERITNTTSELMISLILSFIVSCYWPLFIIHSDLKHKKNINCLLQITSIIIWCLYYLLLYNVKLDDKTYSEIILIIWILPIAFLWIFLIIALLHKENEEKIRLSFSNLIISIVFWTIAWSIIRWWISWALASIKALFDININSNLYNDIWIVSEILLAWSFMFNYYLTTTENINNKLNFKINPSRLRKIFWLCIFIPLTLIYLIIFLIYWIKILATWIRPKWIIIWLWIWYFILWLISSYLILPDKAKYKIIVNKILYISFILIALMMIWAIAKRINQYGITINRWFTCYIIIFIILFSILSLTLKNKSLLIFISSLITLLFISIYWWPINVNNISFNSQVNRLKNITTNNNINLPLTQGVLKNLDGENTKKIIWIIDNLAENYNKNKITNKIFTYKYENSYRSSRYEIRDYLWINTEYINSPQYDYFYYLQSNLDELPINVEWYSKIFNFDERYLENNILKFSIDDQEYEFNLINYIKELKEKAMIQKKNEEINKKTDSPALVINEKNYKLVINWFNYKENLDNWTINFNTTKWYIIIK